MIRFEHLKIYNWMDAIRGMRNSWESWDKSDSVVIHPLEWCNKTQVLLQGFEMGPADYSLAIKLAKAGNDHAKYLRQILVSVDIIAGNEFWKEYDTYKVGTVANSTSMMHKMGSRLLTTSDLSFDVDMPDHLRELAEQAVAITNEAIQAWRASGKQIGSPEWRLMQKIAPMGFIYRRTCTLNYQVLKNMYHSRKSHRLQEWRELAQWVESLPYSELITLKEDVHGKA
ncbi:hypothetical protein [Brevibacillus centrosporus]|uniref:hypothetical protein n=1 Tax=Brevibacillus centrosporus TaxID=54910 RepID=UPI002E244661|nr:hypothetical protein [Brevibacillus centrosporus]